MEKKHIVKFLKAKKRGVYARIADLYADVVSSMAITMAIEIIRDDLEKETREKVELNYFSLAQAVARQKKINGEKKRDGLKKWEFKDANEIKDQRTPGKFKLD